MNPSKKLRPCKYCGKQIFWFRTVNNNSIAVQPDSVSGEDLNDISNNVQINFNNERHICHWENDCISKEDRWKIDIKEKQCTY